MNTTDTPSEGKSSYWTDNYESDPRLTPEYAAWVQILHSRTPTEKAWAEARRIADDEICHIEMEVCETLEKLARLGQHKDTLLAEVRRWNGLLQAGPTQAPLMEAYQAYSKVCARLRKPRTPGGGK